MVALAQAKAEIRALVDRDFNRKSTRGRKRHARFMENYTCASFPQPVLSQPALPGRSADESLGCSSMPAPVEPSPPLSLELVSGLDGKAGRPDDYVDAEILPVFEAALDLPRSSIAPPAAIDIASDAEAANE